MKLNPTTDPEEVKKVCEHIVELEGSDIQCYRFHQLLKRHYGEAVPYYNGEHVLSLIGGRFWDKNGLVLFPLESEPNSVRALEVAARKSLMKEVLQ